MGRLRIIGVLFSFALASHGQTSRGAVSGTIADPSGGVVANTVIELTNTATGIRLAASSNADGLYRFDAVDPGKYEARVAHAGFKTLVASGLTIEANHTFVLDVKLDLGSAETSVDVSASAEILERDGPLRSGTR